ncbi:MAG TPA: hypothetical protein VH186_24235 [Chloroflexia bacterium]|nr:hypothetical protein [Chloroflexia bacterium]
MQELDSEAGSPIARKRRVTKPANWCVMLVTENLFIVGDYRPLAVELLKETVPGGARRFYRTAGPEFFTHFPLSPAQIHWLQEAKLFNGTWELLREYRRPLLDVLALEYPQVWIVENGESRPYQLPASQELPDAETYAFGPPVVMPLTWARSYSLYCHRHRTWEVDPCKDAGRIVEKPLPQAEGSEPPKKKKWPDLELHAPRNTLVRASRKQVSYYLAQQGEPQRLGRDAEGETAARKIIEAQRLAILLRAARAMTTLKTAPE